MTTSVAASQYPLLMYFISNIHQASWSQVTYTEEVQVFCGAVVDLE